MNLSEVAIRYTVGKVSTLVLFFFGSNNSETFKVADERYIAILQNH
jgi:hypothetical protein